MKVSKSVSMNDKNMMKSDKFINETMLIEKEFALIEKGGVLLAGTPYPVTLMDDDIEPIPEPPDNDNLIKIKVIPTEPVLEKGGDLWVENYVGYFDQGEIKDIPFVSEGGIKTFPPPNQNYKLNYLRINNSVTGNEKFPFNPAPSKPTEDYPYRLVPSYISKIIFKLKRRVTSQDLEDNFVATASSLMEFSIGSRKGNGIQISGIEALKFEDGKYSVVESVNGIRWNNFLEDDWYGYSINLDGKLKEGEYVEYFSVDVIQTNADGTIGYGDSPMEWGLAIPYVSLMERRDNVGNGFEDFTEKLNNAVKPRQIINPKLVKGLVFSDVEVDDKTKGMGSLLIKGSVDKSRLPIEVSEDVQKTLKNINFL